MKDEVLSPNDAITKAYDELLEKEKKKIYPYEECPICQDRWEHRKGTCTCHTISNPPCDYCEVGAIECEHTDEEKLKFDEDSRG